MPLRASAAALLRLFSPAGAECPEKAPDCGEGCRACLRWRCRNSQSVRLNPWLGGCGASFRLRSAYSRRNARSRGSPSGLFREFPAGGEAVRGLYAREALDPPRHFHGADVVALPVVRAALGDQHPVAVPQRPSAAEAVLPVRAGRLCSAPSGWRRRSKGRRRACTWRTLSNACESVMTIRGLFFEAVQRPLQLGVADRRRRWRLRPERRAASAAAAGSACPWARLRQSASPGPPRLPAASQVAHEGFRVLQAFGKCPQPFLQFKDPLARDGADIERVFTDCAPLRDACPPCCRR